MVRVPDYLDLEKLFITDIVGIGNDNVFLLLSFVVIVSLAAKMKISNKNFITLLILWVLLMGAFYQSILAIAVLIVGFILSMGIRRLLQGF